MTQIQLEKLVRWGFLTQNQVKNVQCLLPLEEKQKTKTKKCKKCGQYKDINQFTAAVTTTDKLMVYCKTCVKIYNKKYYQAHKAKLLQKSNDRQHNILQYLEQTCNVPLGTKKLKKIHQKFHPRAY